MKAEKVFDNTNTGILFKAKEQKTDKHPGFTGSMNIDGREYWLSAWVRQTKQGEKFFSMSVKAKEAKLKQGNMDSGDDIPW